MLVMLSFPILYTLTPGTRTTALTLRFAGIPQVSFVLVSQTSIVAGYINAPTV